MHEVTVPLDDEIYRYLSFLEKMNRVNQKEDAILAALKIYKKLNMQDWLPHIYRNGDDRILMVTHKMLNDIFSSLSESKLYDVARISALKKKVMNSLDPELDLDNPDNWDVILNGLENLGWGKFTRKGEEIMVEYLGVPIIFLLGYLETLFQVNFNIRQTKDGQVFVLSKSSEHPEIWR